MSRFLELNEAAEKLNVTPEQLVEMRSSGEIRGYRDGGSWKFKIDDIDSFLANRASGGGDDDGGALSFDDLLDDSAPPSTDEPLSGAPAGNEDWLMVAGEEGDDEPSPLVSEEELGQSSESTSSTIIGKADLDDDSGSSPGSDDDDLKLSDESDLTLASESDLDGPQAAGSESASSKPGGGEAAAATGSGGLGSELRLQDAEGSSESEVTLVPGAGLDSDVALVPDPGSDRELTSPSGGSDLGLSSDTGSGSGLPLGSGTASGLDLDSELALSDDDDDDFVLGGDDTGSDLALGAGDSGISLGSPSDSGLSLEADSGIGLQAATDSGMGLDADDLDSGDASSVSSFELPEDEEPVVLGDYDEAQPVERDEEFLLSPSDEMMDDESDSGSQVIALEESETFDQDAATMLQGDGAAALIADTDGMEAQVDPFGAPALGPRQGQGPAPMAPGGPQPAFMPAMAPELPYSIWNVLGLLLVVGVLSVTGIIMTDIVSNMWAWEEAADVSTSISDGITGMVGLSK